MSKQHQLHNRDYKIIYRGEQKLTLSAPNNIIMDFYKTIAIDDGHLETNIIEYILSAMLDYLILNWSEKTIIRMVARLRREQLVAIKAGLKGLPLIGHDKSDSNAIGTKNNIVEVKSTSLSAQLCQTNTTNSNGINQSVVAEPSRSPSSSNVNRLTVEHVQRNVADHLIWRIKTNNISQITAIVMKWIAEHGLREGHIKTSIYDDVAGQLHDWRQKKFIKLYTFGNLSGEDQKLLLASTNHGNLMNVIANCLDGSDKKINPQLIKRFANSLRDKTMNVIYITHDLNDALSCLDGPGIRCAILMNRANEYSDMATTHAKDYQEKIKPLLEQAKLFICNTFDNIHFEPSTNGQQCC